MNNWPDFDKSQRQRALNKIIKRIKNNRDASDVLAQTADFNDIEVEEDSSSVIEGGLETLVFGGT